MSEPSHKRLPNWEPFDEVRMKVVPRLKTSELSGDEWRTAVAIELLHKGRVVVETHAANMRDAALMLGRELLEHSSPIPMEVLRIERGTCDQPGCGRPADVRMVLRELFSDRGDRLDPSDQHGSTYYRQFCARHSGRGDCSREDCRANYEEPEEAERREPRQAVDLQVVRDGRVDNLAVCSELRWEQEGEEVQVSARLAAADLEEPR